ncbi:hypothetical protein IAG44_00670 [Streptomyces roseirectus]|uniref:ASCH domain-containing protein n=1 Tax=Streptomyces roseirectus TaxID=2768066 RepID=A0A7H0IRU4_9ACTN|nr:hypothetical protein IAG44_00670 [Streptomyces roseirectus]
MWPRVGGLRSMELDTPGELRTRLNALALSGAKTATTGLFDDYAREGEGDTSLAGWRANHRRYWADAGTGAGDDTLVVCLAFRLLTPAGTP